MKTPGQAIASVTAVGAITGWINWGVGIVAGIFLAREITKRVKGVDYPLTVAGGYIGFYFTAHCYKRALSRECYGIVPGR